MLKKHVFLIAGLKNFTLRASSPSWRGSQTNSIGFRERRQKAQRDLKPDDKNNNPRRMLLVKEKTQGWWWMMISFPSFQFSSHSPHLLSATPSSLPHSEPCQSPTKNTLHKWMTVLKTTPDFPFLDNVMFPSCLWFPYRLFSKHSYHFTLSYNLSDLQHLQRTPVSKSTKR